MANEHATFAAARQRQPAVLAAAIDHLAGQLAGARWLTGAGPVFVGIGASHAAAAGAVWTLRERGVHSWRLSAGDLPVPFPRSTHPLIGVSQSGRSAETLAALESVPPRLRYAVVNVAPSPISRIAAGTVELGNVHDSYASTIGYTATVAALGMVADGWDGGRLDPGWSDLAERAADLDREIAAPVRDLAPLFATVGAADFVGAGPSVGSAEAAALLFREVARIPATGMGTRQYLHGSMESAGNGVHVLFGDRRELDLAGVLAGAGHQVVLVTTVPVTATDTLHPVRLPDRPPAQRQVLEAFVAQALVAAVAEVRGVEIEEFVFHNPDTKVSGLEAL
jgi:glutamine---fructose-6-phosphate transaminase (isomerizing)